MTDYKKNQIHKECPICGCSASLAGKDGVFWMRCVQCKSTGPEADTPRNAAMRWNKRFDPAEETDQRAKLELDEDVSCDDLRDMATEACRTANGRRDWESMFSGDQEAEIEAWIDGYSKGSKSGR